jgi:putative transposase
MSLKIDFVERASRKGVRMTSLCREFGISRETGYKWLHRFRQEGYEGLEEQSRRPSSHPMATAEEVVMAVLKLREAHPRWGPKKLVELLRGRFKQQAPSRATVARILHRFGQVRKRRHKAPVSVVDRAPVVDAKRPNEVWTVDFKGWWRSGDGTRCEPLTVRDNHSRYLLAAKLLPSTNVEAVRRVFEELFRRYGVPDAIQCDNGQPFISVQSRGGLTRLSAWWVSLGISIVRSRLACPQDNGGHERMHRDLKADVQSQAVGTRLRTQRALDRWRQEFNHVRPHEALHGKTPASIYRPGKRRALRPRMWPYPAGWTVKRAFGPKGCLSINGEDVHISRAVIGHVLGVEPIGPHRARVWLHDVELGEVQVAPPAATIDAACLRFTMRAKKRSA